MGLLQDPKFWEGLKSTSRILFQSFRHVGSTNALVKIRKGLRRNSLLVLLVLPAVFIPILASASVFSFFSSLFSSASVLAESSEQNMPLLQATPSPLAYASTTEDNLSIVQGNSLSKESVVAMDVKSSEDDLISLYVVRSGDTLPAIAKMFNVSVNTIKWANDISGNTVSVGQTLVILPFSGVKHVVKSGDTISSIAKLHDGNIDEIMQYNNITKSTVLAIGDEIMVPDGVEKVTVRSTGGSGGSIKTTSSQPVYEGYYMKPVIGGIKTQGIHGHNGVDLASSYGSNILASADGEVIISRSSGWNGGYGSYIVIKHGNGTQTLYGHLSKTGVSVGQSVKQGQIIGAMGNSGQVSGPTGIHLHFEIRGARNPF